MNYLIYSIFGLYLLLVVFGGLVAIGAKSLVRAWWA